VRARSLTQFSIAAIPDSAPLTTRRANAGCLIHVISVKCRSTLRTHYAFSAPSKRTADRRYRNWTHRSRGYASPWRPTSFSTSARAAGLMDATSLPRKAAR
jgi:hypothetical protein